MLSCLPSMVVTVRFFSVRASLRSRSISCTTSSPSRVLSGCFFYGDELVLLKKKETERHKEKEVGGKAASSPPQQKRQSPAGHPPPGHPHPKIGSCSLF